ncbi:hypothetical protein MRX96_057756 [Rhipicephalus microplus]
MVGGDGTLCAFCSRLDVSSLPVIVYLAYRAQCCKLSEAELCSACGELIADRFLLRVSDSSWHARCLRCCVCGAPLDRQPSCFVRHGSVYCRHDYVR